MRKPVESERMSIKQDDQRAVHYAPGEPKLTMAKCLILATSMTAGKKLDDITRDVVTAWTAKAVQHKMTPEEIVDAFDARTDGLKYFPTWPEILETVQFRRSFAARIGVAHEPKALPEPVTAEQRQALMVRIGNLFGRKLLVADHKSMRREPVIITDEQRAEGQRQIERLRQ